MIIWFSFLLILGGFLITLLNEILDMMGILLQMGQLLLHHLIHHLRRGNCMGIGLDLGQYPLARQRALAALHQAQVKDWQLVPLWVSF